MALPTREKYGLPPRLFLYTLDQIADMLAVTEDELRSMLFYDGRSVGIPPRDKLLARNIAPAGERPIWRVEEAEFIRWMRHHHLTPVGRAFLTGH